MLTMMFIKWFSTTLVVVCVSLAAVRLGPKIGGVLAGMPIVLGPGYFFMIREQSEQFVANASLGSLQAMLATLMFCLGYVLLAPSLGALLSVILSGFVWLLTAMMANHLPGGVFLALTLFGVMLFLSQWYIKSIDLSTQIISAPVFFRDLLVRGVLAGGIVCVVTALLVDFDPVVSGVVLSFPIGMLTIALTLHKRYGVEMARATLANTQVGMISLVAFSAALSVGVEVFHPLAAFSASLIFSVLVSACLCAYMSKSRKID